MSWDFDSIPKYVINLDRRKDRWQQFQSVSGYEELQNLRRWPAVDGKLLNLDTEKDISLFTKYNIIRGTRRSHMELNSKGGVGCYYSHVAVWKDFLEKGKTNVGLVFEDDTIVDSNAIARIRNFISSSPVIQNSEMWDICILGPYNGNTKHEPLYQDDTTCIRLMEFQGLTGYLINKKGLKKLMPMVFPVQGHIDWFLSLCAQLQYIDLCCPDNSLLKVRLSRTDIHKTNKCEICDVKSDFQKEKELVSRSRLRLLQFEELMLILSTFYIASTFIKKR